MTVLENCVATIAAFAGMTALRAGKPELIPLQLSLAACANNQLLNSAIAVA